MGFGRNPHSLARSAESGERKSPCERPRRQAWPAACPVLRASERCPAAKASSLREM